MLGLRLSSSVAEGAAAGWDGGLYRAFTDGLDTAVVLTTAWDSSADADAFEQAVREWFAADGGRALVGRPNPLAVRLAVTTSGDERLREALSTAVSAG